MTQIRVYALPDGNEPFFDWLQRLRDRRARARVRQRIARLQVGNFGDCKSVGGGVQELRIDYGPGYRVYLARRGPIVVVLLCGGDKRTQNRDIARARQYLTDWIERGKS